LLTEVYRKYLASPILAKGVVLVDLPGVTDGNALRVNCANRYLRQCDHVIVVANLDRATDDSGLEKYALEVIRRKRFGKLSLALTRSDIIDEDECRRLRLGPREQEHLQSLHYQEQDVKNEMQKLKTLRYSASAPDFYEEFEKKRGLYEYMKRHVQYRRTDILATTRNIKICTYLQDWYRGITKDPNPLPIFCVSSKINMEHLRGYPVAAFPKLSLEMTGIPALRYHILSLAAKSGKVEQFQRHCVFIRVLLNEMELSCIGSRPMMKRDHLLKILLEVQMNQNHFQALTSDLMKTAVVPVVAKFNTAMDAWLSFAEKFREKLSSVSSSWSLLSVALTFLSITPMGSWRF
jgi:hypothetical protein